jgi:hypothetical protein
MKKTGVIELVSSNDFVKGGERDSIYFGPNFSSTKHLFTTIKLIK